MKRYCFDTSGISTPLEQIPDDIHQAVWQGVIRVFSNGYIAVTTEIYQEMTHVDGMIGQWIRNNRDLILLEIGIGSWDWDLYLRHASEMEVRHQAVISEFNGGSPRTICLNDLSIIALAKTLAVPIVSMETPVTAPDAKKRHIPDICLAEGVEHLDFNRFLRQEEIKG